MSENRTHPRCPGETALVNRRSFLILGGATVTALGTVVLAPGAATAQLVMSTYPEKKLMALSALEDKSPVAFTYPNDSVRNFVVKLGERAGGAIGPDEDIVAFNSVCTHMGGPVEPESYKPAHNVVGPCPLHLTTFDLTKHGMVVSGHATESLPQIALEIRGGDIFAVGIMGLMYGYSINPVSA